MAYFANSTEGEFFKEENCYKCKNWGKNEEDAGGCPIMDLHLFYSYELANSKTKAKKMLDFLIPSKAGVIPKCSMLLK